MDSTKKYLVKNRSAGMVVYRIPEAGIRREFMPGESKKVEFDELEKLIQYKAESGETCLYCSIEELIIQENLSPKEIHRLALVLRCELRMNGYKCEYIDKYSWSTLAMSCGAGPYWKFYGLFISWDNDKIDKSQGYRKSWKIYDY